MSQIPEEPSVDPEAPAVDNPDIDPPEPYEPSVINPDVDGVEEPAP